VISGRSSDEDKASRKKVRKEKKRLAGYDPVTSKACGTAITLKGTGRRERIQ
jgi:hypothetical protein